MTFSMLRNRCDNIIKMYKIKYFWKFCKGRKSKESTVPREMFLGSSFVTGGQSIYNLFSKHFQSIYCNNNQPTLSKCKINGYRHSFPLSTDSVSEDEVLRYLECLDCNKGPGPELIPPYFLKSCAKFLYRPLA